MGLITSGNFLSGYLQRGEIHCKDLRSQAAGLSFSKRLMSITQNTDLKALTDILYARLALEQKTASLAAVHADGSDIEELRWSVSQHKHSVFLGNSSAGTGLDFHLVLARASKNQAMYTALNLPVCLHDFVLASHLTESHLMEIIQEIQKNTGPVS